MNNNQRAIAEKFAIYSEVPLFDQWRLRRSLRWISSDAVSLELLLDFEKQLKEKHLFFWQNLDIILNALSWYNRENHYAILQDGLQSNRLPEMLQIVLIFISKSQRLHSKYRELIHNILRSADSMGGGDNFNAGLITPERFRLEAAELISNLNGQYNSWDSWNPYLETGGNLLLKHMENIAREISNPQLFTLFRFEAAKAFQNRSWSVEKLRYLEKIARKLNDLQSFSEVFNNVVPAIGLETTASLMAISKDFQEFEVFFQQIIVQLELWGSSYNNLFCKVKTTSELDRLLYFLAALPKNVRMTRYAQYTQTHRTGNLQKYISGALSAQKGYVLQECLKWDWNNESEAGWFIERQIDLLEQSIVEPYLNTTWHSSIKSHKIRWEFNKFTEYIPYAAISWDWTKDDEKNRSYWNSVEVEGQEYQRYSGELKPRLVALLRKKELPEVEALFDLLPSYLGIQEFTKSVPVPVEWEKGIEYQEGYNEWDGNYMEKVEVARPKRFIKHDFKFDRPYLQNALDLLESKENIHAANQAQKNSNQGTGF